jgi:hypothetical protein
LFVHTPSQESSLILHLSSTDCTGLFHPVLTASNQARKEGRTSVNNNTEEEQQGFFFKIKAFFNKKKV